jgi:hypothetical protein
MPERKTGANENNVLEFKAPDRPDREVPPDQAEAHIVGIEPARNKKANEQEIMEMPIDDMLEKAGDMLPRIRCDNSKFDKYASYFNTVVNSAELTRMVRKFFIDENKIRDNPALAKAVLHTFIMKIKSFIQK